MPAAIEAAFPAADEVLVLVDDAWGDGNVDPSLRATLSEEATELCQGRCLGLLLFLWQPDLTDDEGSRPSAP